MFLVLAFTDLCLGGALSGHRGQISDAVPEGLKKQMISKFSRRYKKIQK